MEIEIQIEMEIFLNPSTVRGVTKQHQYLRTPLPKGLETNIYKVSGPRLNQGNRVPRGQPCVFNYNKGYYKQ